MEISTEKAKAAKRTYPVTSRDTCVLLVSSLDLLLLDFCTQRFTKQYQSCTL